MAITQATALADFSTGIGTAGAVLQVDNADGRVGIGTTDPQADLQVGIAITMDGTAGVITASSFTGDVTGTASLASNLTGSPNISVGTITATGNVSVGGTLTYEDVTNVDSVGIITARSGVRVTGGDIQAGDTSTGFSGTVLFGFSTTTSGNAGTIQAKNFGSGGANFVGFDAAGNDTARILTDGGALFASDVSIADKIVHTGDTNTAIRFPAADTFTVETGGTEAYRVDSSRRILLGHTSSRAIGHASGDGKLQIEGTNLGTSELSIVRNSDNNGAAHIFIGKSRGSSVGDSTVVQDDDTLGIIGFAGADGTDLQTRAGQIECAVDGTPGGNDMPGRLVFSTTADGASSVTERLRITSAGLVGINVTSPTNTLHVVDTNGTDGSIDFGPTSNRGRLYASSSGIFFGSTSSHAVILRTGNTERARIDTSGRLGLGTHSSFNGGILCVGSVHGSNSPSGEHVKLGQDADRIEFLDSNSNTSDTGSISLYNTVYNNRSADITLYHPAANTGGIKFNTHDGTSLKERMRIDNAGQVLMGSSTSTFNIIANQYNEAALHLSGGGSGSANIDLHGSNHSSDAKVITFDTNSSERMRILSDGRLLVGTTTTLSDGRVCFKGTFSSNRGLVLESTESSGEMIRFDTSSGNAGKISSSGTSTTYSTSSDYRLKENIVDLTGAIDRVKQLTPKRFNFIADADTTVDGFLAHEAQTVVPEAITGTHNGVEVWKEGAELPDGVSVGDNKLDEDGNTIPDYQCIDQSKLVPLLTAALKEAIAEIETLKTKVAALEGS